MTDDVTPGGISAEDWSATPAAVRALVQAQQHQLEVQEAQLQLVTARLATLEERLQQTSRTSSRPPSSDPPSAPPRGQRDPSGRSVGGQVGHEGHGRPLLPVEQVDHVVEVKPPACGQCGGLLSGEDAQPARHQVAELPRIMPEVTEYRRHTLTCVACGAATAAAWPAGVPQGSFGPRTQATVAYLAGRLGISQRDVAELLHVLFQLEISLGSIATLEQQVSAAVAAPVAEAVAHVQQQPVVNADETGWREGTQRRWLWTAVTPLVSVFVLLATRGRAGAQTLLGATFAGIVGSDRWGGYTWVDPAHRQLCWAHLVRDFAAFAERGGEPARVGHALLAVSARIFVLWHRVRDGTLPRSAFTPAMAPLQTQVEALLAEGTTLEHAKTRRACANILKLAPALWTFVAVEGVEPTNNAAERALRRAVVWRRRSFGTQSGAGSRFAERLLTVVTTLRQQDRDVLDYLTVACTAALCGQPAPSLLPVTPAALSAGRTLDPAA
ncbi:MAG: IS66 family transposase [Streptosporangiaceae bacterium]